jgi:uncharacterized protein YndB with AHSA1/START domain
MATLTRSAVHDTFTHERHYAATPSRVFSAWADPAIKVQWFAGPPEGWSSDFTSDFREGGVETNTTGAPGGPTYSYDAVYVDIVANERIVYTYDMHLDDQRISVSVATVEFVREGSGTLLRVTEQGTYLDGLDQPQYREEGVGQQLTALGALLDG